jgi:hypothetical protein
MTGDKPTHNRRLRTRLRGDRGAAPVEFAIVAPLLFLLVFGIIDFGFGFHAWDATQNAAREGARVAATNSNSTTIITRAEDTVAFLSNPVAVSLECAPLVDPADPQSGNGAFGGCGAGASWAEGDLVRVTVEYDYEFMTPLPAFAGMGDTLHMRSVAETRFEGN